jgi:spore coat polysaccharide biosynthesis protein SpsF
MNIGIIIQARMNSSRCPGKILKMIHDKTLLEHIMLRLSYLRHQARVVIATTDSASDDIVETYCKKNGIACFRGSEANVLERYYLCAKAYGMNPIVRLTGDNPFVDVEELDRLIEMRTNSKSDFSHSFKSLPVGVGAEMFTFAALEQSFLEAKAPHHLEHVDEYLLENPRRFKTTELTVTGPKNRPDVRLTVDTETDYRRACFIVEHAKTDPVTTEEAIRLCSQFA